MIIPFTKVESRFDDAKFYLKNYVVNEKRVYDVTITKYDDLVAKKVMVAIEKIATKRPPSTSNKENVASLKKKPTFVLNYI